MASPVSTPASAADHAQSRLAATYLKRKNHPAHLRDTHDSVSIRALQTALPQPRVGEHVDVERYLKYLKDAEKDDAMMMGGPGGAAGGAVDVWIHAYVLFEHWVTTSLETIQPQLSRLLFPVFVHVQLYLLRSGLSATADVFLRRYGARFDADGRYATHMGELGARKLREYIAITISASVGGDGRAEKTEAWRDDWVEMWTRAGRYQVGLTGDVFAALVEFLRGADGGESAVGLARVNGAGKAAASIAAKSASSGGVRADPTLTDDARSVKIVRSIVQKYINIQIVASTEDAEVMADLGLVPADATKLRVQPPVLSLAPVPRAHDAVVAGDDEAGFRAEVKAAVEAILPPDATEADRSLLENAFGLYVKQRDHAAEELESLSDVREVPLPPTRSRDIRAAAEDIRDAAYQVSLGPGSLPSICLYTFHNTKDRIHCMDFSEGVDLCATGHVDSTVMVWSLTGMELRGMRSNSHVRVDTARAETLDAMKEERGPLKRRLVGHSGPVYAAKFLPYTLDEYTPRYLITSSEDCSARLWSLDTWSAVVAYRGHSRPVWDVAVGARGYYFATASADRTACVWATEHPAPVRILAGHMSDVDCVGFHPNGRYVVTGSSDTSARLWDIHSGRTVRLFPAHNAAVTSIAISPDGRGLVTGSADGAVKLWDLASGTAIATLSDVATNGEIVRRSRAHAGPVWSVSWSADSKVIGSGGADGTVRVWDAHTARSNVFAQAEEKTDGEPATQEIEVKMEDQDVKMANPDTSPMPAARSSSLQLGCFATRRTPVFKVQFTRRNLLLAAGVFQNEGA